MAPKKSRKWWWVLIALGSLIFIWLQPTPAPPTPSGRIIWSLALTRSHREGATGDLPTIYAATRDSLYVSADSGKTWSRKDLPTNAYPFITLTADGDGNLAAGTLVGDLYFSRDSGGSWSGYRVSHYPVSSIRALNPTEFMVGTFGGGVLNVDIAADTERVIGIHDPNIWCLTSSGLAFTPSGVYRLSDDSKTFDQISGPTLATACVGSPGHLFAKDMQGQLLVSADDGKSTGVLADLGSVSALAADGDGDALVSSQYGPYWSLDGGQTWAPVEQSRTVSQSSLALSLWAQDIPTPPVNVTRQMGPTLVPPIRVPLGGGIPDSTLEPVQPLNPAAPEDERGGSGQIGGTGGETAQDEQSGGGQGSYGGPPPPPPPDSKIAVFVGFYCDENSSGGIECPDAGVKTYIEDVLQSHDVAEVISKIVAENIAYDKTLVEGGIDVGIDRTLKQLVEQTIDRIESSIEQDFQRMTKIAPSPPPMIAEVKAHVAYVQALRDQAVKEAESGHKSSSSSSSSNDERDSQFSHQFPDTSGEALHQLSYSDIHGAGWWN